MPVAQFVDLHCHWVHEIDDGARTLDESSAMLQGLFALGFSHVVATPHMRPGMYDNTAASLRNAYKRTREELGQAAKLPETSLGSEHFFDALVVNRILQGEGLPYRRQDDEKPRRGGALLLEFLDLAPQSVVEQAVYELQRSGFLVVIAHPERYPASWGKTQALGRLVDRGAVALLDAAALVGKYGRRSRAAADQLLEQGFYQAACSDAHRPADVELLERAMGIVRTRYGDEEVQLLFGDGPRALLEGKRLPA